MEIVSFDQIYTILYEHSSKFQVQSVLITFHYVSTDNDLNPFLIQPVIQLEVHTLINNKSNIMNCLSLV